MDTAAREILLNAMRQALQTLGVLVSKYHREMKPGLLFLLSECEKEEQRHAQDPAHAPR